MLESANPRIGFVILVWNSDKVIGKCLESIIMLRHISAHVIIVDNGSTDSTMNIVEQYAEATPNMFEVIHYSENKGTTISRNAGIKKLKPFAPDFYCILDSDTEINDKALLLMIGEMGRKKQYGLIGPTMVTSRGLVQVSARCFPTLIEKLYKALPIKSAQIKAEKMEIQEPPSPGAISYPVDYLMSACWVIRPEALQKAGLLDEKIFYAPEDAEYCIRIWKNGYQVAFCPGATIIHEWQRISKQKLISRMNWEHVKGLCYMFKKHHYLFTTDKLKKTFKA